MKKNIFNAGRFAGSAGALLLLGLSLGVTGCKEEIDESNYKIASEQTISDYIGTNDSLYAIKLVFDRVKLGKSNQASSLSSVLSARGNYTCFVPSDSALVVYVDSITEQETPTTDIYKMTKEQIAAKMALLSDEQAKKVAYNSVIDNGTQNSYESADFPTSGETFTTTNLSDRRLSCEQRTDNYYYINLKSRVIDWDNEMSNGTVHVVDNVVAPSDQNLAELIQATPNLKIMGMLLEKTGWDNELRLRTTEEEEYELENAIYAGSTKRITDFDFPYMEKRAISFTAFVEPDDVYASDWGLDVQKDDAGELLNKDALYEAIRNKCVAALFPNVASPTEVLKDSAVKNFVAYHLLDGGMASNEFVKHFNEYGYDYVDAKNPQTKNYSVNVWDYYATFGDKGVRGLLKITQLPDGEHDYYLNRVSTHDNGTHGTYKELSCVGNTPGVNGLNVLINKSNVDGENSYDNNALNGFYFTIGNILIYNDETRRTLASERMRIDVATMLPELASNDLRGRQVNYFPNGYFKNIMNESSVTELYYLQDGFVKHNTGWRDYMGDQMMMSGRYDFVLRLPPVPYRETYEVRFGVSLNELRGMVQMYIGEDPNKTEPCGLPIDLRETIDMIPGTPWVADGSLDDETIHENDRNLRNQGYMKAPQYFCVTGSAGKTPARNTAGAPALRRILIQKELDPDKTYYIRFKSTLESTKTQFVPDYFEFVPKSVYASEVPEDIW